MVRPSDVVEIKRALANSTGAATNKSIVAAVTGKRINVVGFIFSSSVATDFTLEDGDATKLLKLLNISAATFFEDDLRQVRTGVGKALQYDTTAGDSEIAVLYYEQ